jgi:serine phosphatase RsbU (regulator of sigma subunit)
VLENSYRRAEELGEQRRISQALQDAMLRPASDHPTVAARYRPAALNLAVGGDWYDVIDLDEHRRAMVVGDCVGHGLESATTMAQLRSAARALLLEGHSPATALEQLDVFATSTPGAFATSVVCVVVDRKRATVTYARAGHPPPLMVVDGQVTWLHDACDPPLQVQLAGRRREATVGYREGSLLVLYTDGLVERRGEHLDLGLGRLADAALRHTDPGVITGDAADALLREMLPRQRMDDVVLVVKRLVVDH